MNALDVDTQSHSMERELGQVSMSVECNRCSHSMENVCGVGEGEVM